MPAALRWNGTKRDDSFVFDQDYDRFDFVTAGAGRDFISDGRSDDYWSSDFFHGQKGSDTLVSTEGYDVLRGGSGSDTFKVLADWFDPADVQFPVPGIEHGQVGFDVEIFGGNGHDRLVLENSDGYTIDYSGEFTIIHTVFGGVITVHGVEEFEFL